MRQHGAVGRLREIGADHGTGQPDGAEQQELQALIEILKQEPLENGSAQADTRADGEPAAVEPPPLEPQECRYQQAAAQPHNDPAPNVVD